MNLNTSQHGNALFMVLIAVVLFAALSVAITRSGTGSASPRDKYQVEYGQVLNAMDGISSELQKLVVRGCAVETIDIEPRPTSDVPLDAGQDSNCILFNTRGGNASPIIGQNGNPAYTISLWPITNIGTTAGNDVIIMANTAEVGLPADNFCSYVNNRYGIATTESSAMGINSSDTHLDFSPSAFDLTSAYAGKTVACFKSTSANANLVYSVIIDR